VRRNLIGGMDFYSSWACEPFNMAEERGWSEINGGACPSDPSASLVVQELSIAEPRLMSSLDWTASESLDFSPRDAEVGNTVTVNDIDTVQDFDGPSQTLIASDLDSPSSMVDIKPDPQEDDIPAPQRFASTKMGDRHVCPIFGCKRNYTYKRDLKHHMKKKHPDRIDETYAVSRPRSDKANKPFCCSFPDCPSGFKHKRDLNRHIIAKHPNESTPKYDSPEFLTLYFGRNPEDTVPLEQSAPTVGIHPLPHQPVFLTFDPNQDSDSYDATPYSRRPYIKRR